MQVVSGISSREESAEKWSVYFEQSFEHLQYRYSRFLYEGLK